MSAQPVAHVRDQFAPVVAEPSPGFVFDHDDITDSQSTFEILTLAVGLPGSILTSLLLVLMSSSGLSAPVALGVPLAVMAAYLVVFAGLQVQSRR